MTLELTDWDNDLPSEGDEEYQALVRALKFTEGFGLFFIRCSRSEGEQIITKLHADIVNKNIQVLRLTESVNNLYEIIDKLDNKEQIKILFITGLEHSLEKYEECKKLTGWNSRDIHSYSWKGVPPVLINLNQQRERFRDNFNICFVFLLPQFAIKYFIQRAPDFFDWRSGLFEFSIDPEILEQESLRKFLAGDYERYLKLTPEERNQEILELQGLITEEHQIPSRQYDLLINLGDLQLIEPNYKEALISYNQALKFKPDNHEAWYKRGDALFDAQNYEEAIASYDKAIELKPENYSICYKKAEALRKLGRYEQAITNYENFLAFNPNEYWGWYHRGLSFSELGHYEEAIASYDQAINLNNKYVEVWANSAMAFYYLGNYEQALIRYDKAIALKPESCAGIYYYKACCFAQQNNNELAINNLNSAIAINPDKYRLRAKNQSDFLNIKEDTCFQALIQP